MEDRNGQLNMSEMTRADLDILFTRLASVHAIDGAEPGIIQTLLPRLLFLFILRDVSVQLSLEATCCTYHGLRIDDVNDAHGLDFFRRQQAELNLLDCAQRALGGYLCTRRHDGE